MKKSFRALLAIFATAMASTSASACEVERLLRGQAEASAVTNKLKGEQDFNTYLVRNSARGKDGVLQSSIRFTLSPARWGFDMRLPNDKLLAGIRQETVGEDGTAYQQWVIEPYEEFKKACGTKKFVLKAAKLTEVHIMLNDRKISTITDFPYHEAF